MLAAEKGHVEVVRLLVDMGADVAAKNKVSACYGRSSHCE